MKIFVIPVGTRQPAWIEEGIEWYVRRMPREYDFRILSVAAEHDRQPTSAQLDKEAAKLVRQAPLSAHRVALDEKGRDMTSADLAVRLERWRESGAPIALFMGGHHGLPEAISKTCRETIRLSSLTLPHGLARLLLVEALYRAMTILQGHPYHRE